MATVFDLFTGKDPFSKEPVSVQKSPNLARIEDIVQAFRQSGPEMATLLRANFLPNILRSSQMVGPRQLPFSDVPGIVAGSPEARAAGFAPESFRGVPDRAGSYVTQAYRSLLGREPGGDEAQGWVKQLAETGDPAGILSGIAGSPEFQGRGLNRTDAIRAMFGAGGLHTPTDQEITTNFDRLESEPLVENQLARARDLTGMSNPIVNQLMAAGNTNLARAPIAAPARRDESGFSAGLKDLFATAAHPVDDDLTNFFRDRFARETNERMAQRGLVGQGRGEALTNEAMRDFEMGARDRADQRRSGALTTANQLQGGLSARDIADFQAQLQSRGSANSDQANAFNQILEGLGLRGRAAAGETGAEANIFNTRRQSMSDLENLAQAYHAIYGSSLLPLGQAAGLDQSRLSLEAQLKAAEPTAFEGDLKNLQSIASIAGAFMGMGGLGGVGGGAGLSLGGQSASIGGVGNYSLFGGAGGGGGMTPWNTPMPSYSLTGAGGYNPNSGFSLGGGMLDRYGLY